MTTQGPTGAAPTPAPSGSWLGKLVSTAADIKKAVDATQDASNTTNKGELIVTATFPFVADTILPTDVLFTDESCSATKNHRNWISCDKAPPDQTTTAKTLCRGERIVHEKTNIGDPHGPPSDNDDFDGEGGGVANGLVFKKNAHPVVGQCSPDCDVEGKPVVRHHDPSKQNKDNTDGLFLHTGLDYKKPPLDKLKARRCTVENVKAVCEKGREMQNGRLEVLEGNFVTITMDWVNNATTDPAARKRPECQLPKTAKMKHPIIAAFRKEHDLVTNDYPKLEKSTTGKQRLLDADWVGEKPEEKALSPKKPELEETKAEQAASDKLTGGSVRSYDGTGKPKPRDFTERPGNAEQIERARRPPPAIQTNQRTQALQEARNPSATPAAGAAAARQAQGRDMVATRARDAAFGAQQEQRIARARNADELAGHFSKINAGWQQVKSIAEFARAWNVKPMEIRVEGQGCAGAQIVTLGVMPRGTWTFNVFDLEEIKNALKSIQTLLSSARTYLSKIKGLQCNVSLFELIPLKRGETKEQLDIVVMNAPMCSFAFEYRELERDADKKGEIAGRKKNQVHKAWRVEIGVETAVGVCLTFRFPIARFAPALGELGVLLLRLANIEIAIEIVVDLGCGLKGEFGQDEYGLLYSAPVVLTPRAVFSIGLVCEFGEFAKATAKVKGSVKLELAAKVTAQGIFMERRPSRFNLELEWKAEVDLWGWKAGTGDTYPLIDPITIPKNDITICSFGS